MPNPSTRPHRPRPAARAVPRAPAPHARTRSTADLCDVRCVDADRVGRARAALPDDETVSRAAWMLRVLGDATRLKIVRALATEELCVCDLATLLQQSQSTISHSLRSLRQMRLVRYRRAGKVAYYAVEDAHVADVAALVFAHVQEE